MIGVALPLAAAARGSGGAAAGSLFGLVYFAALRRSVRLHGGDLGLAPLLLGIGRLAGAVAFFGLAARCGAGFTLSAVLGFLLARKLAIRAARSAG